MPTLYIEALFMIVVQSWLPVTSDAMSLSVVWIFAQYNMQLCICIYVIVSVSKIVGRNIGFQSTMFIRICFK